jgi:hypothetical protein
MRHTWRKNGVTQKGERPVEDATQTTEWCRTMNQRVNAVGVRRSGKQWKMVKKQWWAMTMRIAKWISKGRARGGT